jgi:tetratricopeptide (TPR) repeat protein
MREKRIAHLREALAQDPNDSFSRYALALEFAGMGDLHEALQLLEDLLTRDPSYLPAYQQLGSLYTQAQRTPEAVVILKRGIELAQQQQDLLTQSELQEALDDLES